MKNNKGFSLVELIVVIAIMAILAAIAIPTFAHFITKANQASDDELLHNINYIFSAACLENGVDVKEITGATITYGKDTDIVLTDVTMPGITNDLKAKIIQSFTTHFGEMKTEKFKDKEITALYFDAAEHKFVPNTVDSLTIEYAGVKIQLDPDDVTALKNSTFGEMGMGALLGELDKVSGIAAKLTNEAFTSIIQSEDFLRSAAASLGIDTSVDGWQQQLATKRSALVSEMMAKDPSLTEEQALAQINANATVLYTAQQTAKLSNEDIDKLLLNPSKDEVIQNMTDNPTVGLSQAALLCGLYTSYINSEEYTGPENPEVGVTQVITALDDENFIKYIKGTQGTLDREGYLSSLNMINSSTNDPDAVSQLMVNGFADPDLVGALNSSLGK